ncbi:MAG: type IV pilus modification protein PilV [Caldimonas sp.]
MKNRQDGFFLIEAMVALLIFALGILGMVAMGSTAVSSQSDARYRTAAANLADEMASTIALNVDRTSAAATQASVATFTNLPSGAPCTFSGSASLLAAVTAWRNKASTVGANLPGLPGASNTQQQIVVDNSATGFNRVEITVCWQAPTDSAMRHHTLVTYVN